jgi:thioester reductase-like protein
VSSPIVLTTGGTGLVGRAILDALGDVTPISLTRHGAAGWQDGVPRSQRSVGNLLAERHGHVVKASDGDHVEHVVGDITDPRLGLSEAEYAALADRVAVVVHAAGVSDFTTPRRVTQALNVEGTRNVARFAERARAPLYHVGTSYIVSRGTSVRGRWGAQVYLDSKREAERIARECRTFAAIIRPSVLFGHSRDGSAPSFQGFHRFVGLMLKSEMPLLPFPPETRVDFLPHDVVGEVTARLVREGFEGEFLLTAGSDALTFARVIELVQDLGRDLGVVVEPPRFVTMDMIDRLIKPAGGEAVARRVDLLLALSSHFVEEPLPCSLEDRDRVDLEAAFLKGVRFWAETQDVAAGAEGVPA